MTTFKLLAVPFHSRSQDLGGFVEVWVPSAVERTLAEHVDLRALKDHNPSWPLGRISAGTLKVHTDARGLHATIDSDDDISWVHDLRLSVRRGDITGASFAFNTIAVSWLPEEPLPVRQVTDAVIKEVSIVNWPAFLGTTAAVTDGARSLPSRGTIAMRHDTADTGLEYAAPRSPHDRRDLALLELAQAKRYWRDHNPRGVFELAYAPPRPPRAVTVTKFAKTKMPSAFTTSPRMLAAYMKQISVEESL
jgi:HK97 family phage prohead protease